MSEISTKDAIKIVELKKKQLDVAIAKLIDGFEEEAGTRLGDQEIKLSYASDNSGKYVARVETKLSI
jgi:hypothetical protein